MADDNKSCHCEFVPQDLTPALKVTIRAIWYEQFPANIRFSATIHRFAHPLFAVYSALNHVFIHITFISFFVFFFKFLLTPGSKVPISCWVRAVSLTSVSFIALCCFTVFCCVVKAPLLRHYNYYCYYHFSCVFCWCIQAYQLSEVSGLASAALQQSSCLVLESGSELNSETCSSSSRNKTSSKRTSFPQDVR